MPKQVARLLLCVIFLNFCRGLKDSTESIESSDPATTLVLDGLQLTLSKKLLLDIRSPSGKVLRGYLGWLPLHSNVSYIRCADSEDSVCLQYGETSTLTVKADNVNCNAERSACDTVACYTLRWQNHLSGAMDCFVLGNDLWYGGGERLEQRWPLQDDSRPWHAYVTGDPLHHATGSVIENLWLTSGGFAIHVDRKSPLFLSFNESKSGQLCFATSRKKYPYSSSSNQSTKELKYSVCAARNIKDAYSHAAEKWLKKPLNISDELMFQNPIWSTWAKYKRDINQITVLEFARGINEKGFPNSQLEIDDQWEDCYGELQFDDEKFPDPSEMIRNLRYLGYRTTLWVHPFCNVECATFDEGVRRGFWVKNSEGNPALVKWWNGLGAVLDATNEAAVDWFVDRLRALQKIGIDSFKFDAGETSWLPEGFVLHSPQANDEPNLYSQLYAEMAHQLGLMVEVRVGYDSQHLPIFVRMFDKFSDWSYANGLKSVIPMALHLSLMGYPFILPDMIGGNSYNGSAPSKELYLRWVQANVFLPAMQFSTVPWDYDDEATAIARKMVKLHQKYSFFMISVATAATTSHAPIIRPLWWLAPDDPVALTIDSEFLVGDVILVAPVLDEGSEERDIYLPEGRWTDMLRGDALEGPQWLRSYKALLAELPFFMRLQ